MGAATPQGLDVLQGLEVLTAADQHECPHNALHRASALALYHELDLALELGAVEVSPDVGELPALLAVVECLLRLAGHHREVGADLRQAGEVGVVLQQHLGRALESGYVVLDGEELRLRLHRVALLQGHGRIGVVPQPELGRRAQRVEHGFHGEPVELVVVEELQSLQRLVEGHEHPGRVEVELLPQPGMCWEDLLNLQHVGLRERVLPSGRVGLDDDEIERELLVPGDPWVLEGIQRQLHCILEASCPQLCMGLDDERILHFGSEVYGQDIQRVVPKILYLRNHLDMLERLLIEYQFCLFETGKEKLDIQKLYNYKQRTVFFQESCYFVHTYLIYLYLSQIKNDALTLGQAQDAIGSKDTQKHRRCIQVRRVSWNPDGGNLHALCPDGLPVQQAGSRQLRLRCVAPVQKVPAQYKGLQRQDSHPTCNLLTDLDYYIQFQFSRNANNLRRRDFRPSPRRSPCPTKEGSRGSITR
uniref:Uncharacterized protein n=1 Tax=Spironucleus salmonicida TaxID=348837 RepID=V6LZ92_9EUKA|eukprot:EST49061.1 Hypothetical protein SS50377_10684 [Spironucleus salmonicida]